MSILRKAGDIGLYVICISFISLLINVQIRAGDSDINNAQKEAPNSPSGPLYDSVEMANKGNNTITLFKADRSVIVADLKELTRRSTDIIVGRPVNNRSRLNDTKDDIYSLHLLRVQSVIKGSIANESLIELKMPGGGWRYSDRTTILKFPSDASPIRNNVSYFVFMKKENPQARPWMPALGIQGIFEIDSDTNSIIPCDRVELDPVVKRYKNASIADFMTELMAAVASETKFKKKEVSSGSEK